MNKVLFIGSGTQAFAVLEGLAKNGNKIFMITPEHGNYADVSRYIAKIIYDDISVERVKSIIEEYKIDCLIPTGDSAAEFISKNKELFLKISHVVAPDYKNFVLGYDKNCLMRLCRENGYPHPLTIDLSLVYYNDCSAFSAFPYPGLLKPNSTTGGRGMVLINCYDDLLKIYPEIRSQYGECHLQRFIREGGRQVKLQLYVDKEGNLLQHSVLNKVRWYPVKGGSSCCSITIEEEKMVAICHKILKDIHWEGFADFDAIEDPDRNELLIMEINPRIPACIGAAVEAGVNWGQILVDGCMGKPIIECNYQEGVALRHLGFDILWFFKSSNRFKAHPSWFHFFGKNVHYQDFHLCDQKPFWVGTIHNIKKLFDPSFKKAKSGTSAV